MAADSRDVSLRDARVLVTGAAGFIGRHLCRRLRSEGAYVIGVSRVRRELVAVDGPEDPSAWRRADLTDAATARGVVAETRPDVIVHLASLVAGSRDRALVWPMLEANLLSTVVLLEAAAESGCARFVHAGSLEEPTAVEGAPCSPYAAAKAASSSYVRLFAAQYGLSAVIARLFMVYGPGVQDPNKLVSYVIRQTLKDETIRLSSGVRQVDWVYVADVVEGLVQLARRRDLEGESVDLGSGTLIPVRQAVEILWRELGREDAVPFGTLPDRTGEVVRAADAEQTEQLLDWRATVPLDEGLRRTVEWFKAEVRSS